MCKRANKCKQGSFFALFVHNLYNLGDEKPEPITPEENVNITAEQSFFTNTATQCLEFSRELVDQSMEGWWADEVIRSE
jgi:hypothetical protein